MDAMHKNEKIKICTSTIYPQLVRNMDNHYSASNIASDVQRDLDWGPRISTTNTLDPIVMYTHETQRLDKLNRYPNEPGQVLSDIKHQLLRISKKIFYKHT